MTRAGSRFSGPLLEQRLDRRLALEHADGHEGVELGPRAALADEGEPSERQPAARLAPHRHADDVRRLFELSRIVLVVPADKGRILAAALVLRGASAAR